MPEKPVREIMNFLSVRENGDREARSGEHSATSSSWAVHMMDLLSPSLSLRQRRSGAGMAAEHLPGTLKTDGCLGEGHGESTCSAGRRSGVQIPAPTQEPTLVHTTHRWTHPHRGAHNTLIRLRRSSGFLGFRKEAPGSGE